MADEQKVQDTSVPGTGSDDQKMDVSELEETKLPCITELIAPEEFPPAAFSTTISTDVTQDAHSAQYTTTLPANSQIVIPVLPECIPLIAEVPDVVPEDLEKGLKENEAKEEVKISQVLPGYAPSYASDYVPSEINTNTYNSFVNTLSFNVSRYPTLTEITDSSKYTKDGKKIAAIIPTTEHDKKTFDYVPAEYLTGQATKVKKAKVSQTMCSMMKPEVLNSGRIMTTMCAIPIASATSSEASETPKPEDLTAPASEDDKPPTATAEAENGGGDSTSSAAAAAEPAADPIIPSPSPSPSAEISAKIPRIDYPKDEKKGETS